MDPNRGEDLGRPFRLLCLHPHLIRGDPLLILLAKHCDDIEGGASGQANSNKLNGFGAGAASGVVQNQIVAGPSLRDKLTLLLKWLCEFDLRGNHECLLQIWRQRTRINAESLELLQGISGNGVYLELRPERG